MNKDFSMKNFPRKIERDEIDVHKSDKHYFLEIHAPPYFDIFRSFDSLINLIAHLKLYPIKNKQKIIKEIIKNNKIK